MSAEASTVTVLVVDDHPMVAAGLVAAVSEEPDMTVVGPARTLLQMRSILGTERVDVILLDLALPDGHGLDGVAQARQLSPDTQVVVLTGQASDTLIVDAIEAGCSGFLTKDADLDEIVEAIRVAARGEVLLKPRDLARVLPRLRAGPHKTPADSLTAREREVLGLIAAGLTNADMARRLHLSVNTVRNHVQNVLSKLDAHSKLQALSVAVAENIVTPGGPNAPEQP